MKYLLPMIGRADYSFVTRHLRSTPPVPAQSAVNRWRQRSRPQARHRRDRQGQRQLAPGQRPRRHIAVTATGAAPVSPAPVRGDAQEQPWRRCAVPIGAKRGLGRFQTPGEPSERPGGRRDRHSMPVTGQNSGRFSVSEVRSCLDLRQSLLPEAAHHCLIGGG